MLADRPAALAEEWEGEEEAAVMGEAAGPADEGWEGEMQLEREG